VVNNYFGVFMLKHSYDTLYKVVDKGVLEIITVNWLAHGFVNLGRLIYGNQTGLIYGAICLIVLSFVVLCSLVFLFV